MLGIRTICFSLLFALVSAQPDPLVEGITHFQRGEYAAAECSFKEALRKHDDPRARAFLALARAANGECGLVSTDLQRQLSNLTDPELRRLTGLALARCYASTNDFENALNVLVRLKKLYPADADVLYETAQLHMRAWNEAVQEMFRATPASFRVNQLSGEIFENEGKYSEAAEQFREAIAKNPKALDLHFRLGRALLMSSHSPNTLSQAQREFETELALNPSDAVAEYEMGEILISEQKSSEAIPHLKRAVDLDSRFPEALITLAKLKLETKQENEAIRLLEQAVHLVPNSEAARYNLMIAYRNAGRMQDSLREKRVLDQLQKPPEGEFTEFLKKLGEKVPQQ